MATSSREDEGEVEGGEGIDSIPPPGQGRARAGAPQPNPAARRRRWALLVGVAVMLAIAIVVVFLLTQATGNRDLYERNYAWLFALNVVVAGLLFLVLAWGVLRLASRLKRGKFGSRLLVKLAAIFALVGVLPGLVIYTVSYQFVSRSIESWFDVKVEGALDAGLALGRATLDALANDLAFKTRGAALQLAEAPDSSVPLALERLRDQLSAADIVLWSGTGQPIASAGESRFQLSPERPTPQQFKNVREQRQLAVIEGLDEAAAAGSAATGAGARIKALALVTVPGTGLTSEPRVLQVTQPLPATLVANAIAVQEANREYQERALGRQGLRRMYIGTLTLSLILAVFGAVLLAVVLGNQLARPLLLLAAGVREVAAGDLSPKAVLQGKDELGGLTRSFADMTQQIADARGAVQKSIDQLDAARAGLQTILDNLTAGVVVIDDAGRIQLANPGATRILRTPLAAYVGQPLAGVPGLGEFGQAVQAQFGEYLNERRQHGLDHWQQSFELGAPTHDAAPNQSHALTLLARGAEMPAPAGGRSSRLLVFDDISEIVSAQRAQAWGEVARRLAHEIKNPLTPIQLSAERLAMKLQGKLDVPEQAIVTKAVKTIVDQVDAMKRLVNEFRDYARLPSADLKPIDLNALVSEVLQLYGAQGDGTLAGAPRPDLSTAADASPSRAPSIEIELDPSQPRILGDAQQLRQVLHNLLQNAQDAAEARPAGDRRVVVRTRLSETGRRARLVVQDSGPGFADPILKRAFEPYVTTKPKGTGLGLAVVKKIADEHAARVDIANRVDADGLVEGAQVSLSFALAA